MKEEEMETVKSELENAIAIVNGAGYTVIHPLAPVAKPYIGELSDIAERAGYRLDEAKIERSEKGKATGRIILTVFPFKVLEYLEHEGKD
jgi:hypothetical protein